MRASFVDFFPLETFSFGGKSRVDKVVLRYGKGNNCSSILF